HALELSSREDVDAALLPSGEHEAALELLPELGGKDHAALVVELGRVGAEEHIAPSRPACEIRRRPPTSSTLLHFAPQLLRICHAMRRVPNNSLSGCGGGLW